MDTHNADSHSYPKGSMDKTIDIYYIKLYINIYGQDCLQSQLTSTLVNADYTAQRLAVDPPINHVHRQLLWMFWAKFTERKLTAFLNLNLL
jgi:hypothetical protein